MELTPHGEHSIRLGIRKVVCFARIGVEIVQLVETRLEVLNQLPAAFAHRRARPAALGRTRRAGLVGVVRIMPVQRPLRRGRRAAQHGLQVDAVDRVHLHSPAAFAFVGATRSSS